MHEFDKWISSVFETDGVETAVKEIIRLYELSPTVNRSDPIKALRDAYAVTNRDGKVKTLVHRDEKLRALNVIRQQLHDKYEYYSTKIYLDEFTPLSEIGKYVCKNMSTAGRECISVTDVAEYIRDHSDNTLECLRFLTGFILGSNIIFRQEECALLVNIATVYIMSLGIPIVLNPDFEKKKVVVKTDVYTMGSQFFLECSLDSVNSKNAMARMLSKQFSETFGVTPVKLIGITENSTIDELLDSAKHVLLQTEPPDEVYKILCDIKTSKESLTLSMLSNLMYKYIIEHDFNSHAVDACYTYGILLMTKHKLNIKLNTKLTVKSPAFI